MKFYYYRNIAMQCEIVLLNIAPIFAKCEHFKVGKIFHANIANIRQYDQFYTSLFFSHFMTFIIKDFKNGNFNYNKQKNNNKF